MKVRLENSALVGDLSEFLRRCQCLVEQVGRETLRVDLDGPVSFEADSSEMAAELTKRRRSENSRPSEQRALVPAAAAPAFGRKSVRTPFRRT